MAGLLARIHYRFFKSATDNAAKATENPGGPTQEAAEQPWRDLDQTAQETDAELRKAAREKAIDDLLSSIGIKGLKQNGLKAITWVVERVEKGIRWLTKPRSGGKSAMLTTGVIVIVAAATATRVYQAAPRHDPVPPPSPVSTESNSVNGIVIPTPLPDFHPVPDGLVTSDGEMGRAYVMLGVRSLEDMGREHVDLDVSDPPPLPAAIAAASAAPVAVSAQRGTDTYTVSATVGQVYQALPEDARAGFVREVRDSPSSDHSIRLKDNYTVSSPIGSLTISSS